MIELRDVSKRYGKVMAVDGLTLSVRPGRVTGFLGPNGAGKSTTMRLILGLDRPDRGEILVDGRRYASRHAPLHEIGAVMEGRTFHPGRKVRDHLRWLAASNDIAESRIGEVLDQVGLATVAGRRAGKLSLGMSQRLSIAAALLGDPAVLILDEPLNGLDPAGIVWVRNLARELAGQGRTVLISSHLMNEMAVTADHVLVIGRGRLLADIGVTELVQRTGTLEEAFLQLTEGSAEFDATPS